ncbi:MAG: hypothetical protein JXD23_02530 [Spirochaetales bacterium]|nr:hypothetical protein [Spirochaetales bacterium]
MGGGVGLGDGHGAGEGWGCGEGCGWGCGLGLGDGLLTTDSFSRLYREPLENPHEKRRPATTAAEKTILIPIDFMFTMKIVALLFFFSIFPPIIPGCRLDGCPAFIPIKDLLSPDRDSVSSAVVSKEKNIEKTICRIL